MTLENDVKEEIIKIFEEQLLKEEDTIYSSFIVHFINNLNSCETKRRKSAVHVRKKRKLSVIHSVDSKMETNDIFKNNAFGALIN